MNSFDPVHCVRKALLEPIAFRRDVMFIKHRKERTKVCTAGQARQSTRDCHHLAAVLFIRALVCWIGAGFLGESLYNHFQPGGSTLWFSGQVYSLVTLWWFTAICSMGSFTLGTFAFFRWFLEYLYYLSVLPRLVCKRDCREPTDWKKDQNAKYHEHAELVALQDACICVYRRHGALLVYKFCTTSLATA